MEPHHNSDSKFATQGEADPSSTSSSRVSNSVLQSVILSAILSFPILIFFLDFLNMICCLIWLTYLKNRYLIEQLFNQFWLLPSFGFCFDCIKLSSLQRHGIPQVGWGFGRVKCLRPYHYLAEIENLFLKNCLKIHKVIVFISKIVDVSIFFFILVSYSIYWWDCPKKIGLFCQVV